MNHVLKRFLVSIAVTVMILCAGCANVQPGANILVVRAEQTETAAMAAFDLVLKTDDSNRQFYRENAPKFHAICEWLREPIFVSSTRILPRSLALISILDDAKRKYLDSGDDKQVTEAIRVLLDAINQAMSAATSVQSLNAHLPSTTLNLTP